MAKEWRIFTDMGAVIAFTDYWGLAREGGPIETPPEAVDAALCASNCLASLIPFCAIDVALTARGEYIVVEVNHGGLSGLNGIDPRLSCARIADLMMGRDLLRHI
jgi:glutathione synthase/RimK-type ligase-like ATP-grasp enzyme